MSAYLVENRTIDTILSSLTQAQYNQYGYIDTYSLPASLNTGERDKLTRLGKKMLLMNCQSLRARYGDKIDRLVISNYQFKQQLPPNLYQLYKSVQCLTYQCCEGNIPETSQLYRDLETFCDIIARKIVSLSPKYDSAEWG
jgi:hypothetical protein